MTVDIAGLPDSAGSTKARAYRSDRVEKVMRERDVIKLGATGGYSDKEISELLSAAYEAEGRRPITARQVKNARDRALRRYAPAQQLVDQIRGEQLLRLDQLLEAQMSKALEGNVRAAETVLKIEAARSRLVGTEAPKKIEHGGSIFHSHEIADTDEVQALEEAFASGARSFDIDATAEDLGSEEMLLELPAGDE